MILIGQLKKMITIPWKTNIWKHEIKKKKGHKNWTKSTNAKEQNRRKITN